MRTIFALLCVFAASLRAAPGPLLDPQFAGTTAAQGAPPKAGVQVTETFGVRLANGGTGVLRVGERVCLAEALAVEGDAGVYVEAESAEQTDERAGTESPRTKDDKDAGGGRYVDNPQFMSVPFRLTQTGNREVYARVREGKDDRNRYFWTIDGGRRWLDSKELKGKKGRWRWIGLGRVGLTGGDHRLLLHSFWKGDFHFDRFALLPLGSPPPGGVGAQEVTMRPDNGTVETRDVTPPALLGLVHVSARNASDAGAIGYHVSQDGGKAWHKAPRGALTSVQLRGGEQDTFRLKATLTRLPDGRSPALGGIDVAVRPDPAGWLALRNDFIRVVFDRATGRLFRLTDLVRNREIAWTTQPSSLFSVDLKNRGARAWLRYSDEQTHWVTLKPGGEGEQTKQVDKAEGLGPGLADAVAGAKAEPATFVSGRTAGSEVQLGYVVEQHLRLRFRIGLDRTAQTIWTAEVTNGHPDLDVIRLQFPRFASLRLGDNGMDDHQLRCQSFGHHRTMPGIATLRNAKYPGSVVLPWESVHDDQGGFAVTVRDARGTNVGFESAAETYFGDTFSHSIRKYDNVSAGGGKALWEYAVAVHPGHWHWPADRYREWAVRHFVRPKYPAWLAQSDGFYNVGIQNSGTPFKDFVQLAEGAQRIGFNHVQIWGQFTGRGEGCCGPYWMPSPRYGTLDEFQQGIADLHGAGMRVGFYFLYDRVDLYHAKGSHIYGIVPKSAYPPNAEFPTHDFFLKHQLVGSPDGKPTAYPLTQEQWAEYEEKLQAYCADPKKNRPPRKWHPIDLSHPDWWEYLRHWAIDKYVEEWGADGHYYDVLGTGRTRESYDLRKGHHGHGLSGIGRMGVARTTVECARARGHRDYFLLMEGMCDLPGQWTAAMISGLYYNHCETMRYTWPDLMLYEGHSNSGHHRPIRSLEAAFLNGNRFDIVFSNDAMWRVIDTRACVRDWIYRGRFMDTLGLESPVPARLFVRRDPGARGTAVTFVNPDGEAGVAKLDMKRVGRPARAISVDQTGRVQAVELTQSGDKTCFAVPTAHFSVVVLAEAVSPSDGLVGRAALRRDAAKPKLVVTLANLSGSAVAGTICPPHFEPLGLSATPLPFTIRPGQVERIEVAVQRSPEFWRSVRLRFDVRLNGKHTKTIETTAFPLVRDASFEHTGNDTTEVNTGHQSLRLDPATGTYHRIYPLYLTPGRRYRVSLAYKRTGGKARMNMARIWQRLGERSQVNQVVMPFREQDRWARTETTFTCADRFVSTSLYIYNWDSGRTVWVDDVRVEAITRHP